jgi:arginase family enzyme
MPEPTAIHLNLDDAWDANPLGLRCVDARAWGPRVRYFAPARLLEAFAQEVLARLPPFVLYGSGDFHHLAGMLIGRVTQAVTVVSFDNHPDWDLRPPRWGCGGWVNRALEMPQVEHVSIWGCGNFELDWPARAFSNRRALREHRLSIHAWAERYGTATARRFDCMTRETWRGRFEAFARQVAGRPVYVTVDLDCLRAEEAATNWENGLFTAADVAWAIGRLKEVTTIVAGDMCGACSPPTLERWTQRFASWWDHPKLAVPADARARNLAALKRICVASWG